MRFSSGWFSRCWAGIYTADPEKLSISATMPQFVEQEQQFGSLARAAWSARSQAAKQESRESGARYGLFLAPRLGMQQLIDAVVGALPAGSLRLGTRVEQVSRGKSCWRVQIEGAPNEERFDAVVVTTPAHHAASLVRSADSALAETLAQIDYAGCSVVCLGFERSQIRSEIPGFGFVIPSIEGRRAIAVSFSSLKFPGRAPDRKLLLRVFVGGALQPELANLDDDELQQLAIEELRELVGLEGAASLCQIARWPRGMPQYHVGHLGRVAQIEKLVAPLPGMEIAGAAYRGVGMPQCIHDGQQAADRVAEFLTGADQQKTPGAD